VPDNMERIRFCVVVLEDLYVGRRIACLAQEDLHSFGSICLLIRNTCAYVVEFIRLILERIRCRWSGDAVLT
jgi:hypothetical protein